MLRKIETPRYEAFLARYRLEPTSLGSPDSLPSSLKPIWTAMLADAAPAARRNAEYVLAEKRLFAAEERAGIQLGLAAALLRIGSTDLAWEASRHSLELMPRQSAATRLQIAIHSRRRQYEAAYSRMMEHEEPSYRAAWDTPITNEERGLTLASLSWLTGQWEEVARHLTELYPNGLTVMPDEIREDWFRLSLYRDLREEAAAAASLLIASRPIERTDEILQTIVQNGWTTEALPLYKVAFDREPGSELFRRRLVALCIKEGELDEARRLTAPGALRTAA